MVLFSRIGDGGEVAKPAGGCGAGSGRVAFQEGDDAVAGQRLQPPAVPEQPSWQPRSPELDGDDFPHAPIMGSRLAELMG